MIFDNFSPNIAPDCKVTIHIDRGNNMLHSPKKDSVIFYEGAWMDMSVCDYFLIRHYNLVDYISSDSPSPNMIIHLKE